MTHRPQRTRGERQKAEGSGQRGEKFAAWWLRLKGYRIVERHFRAKVGEIDLVARRGSVLAFVEVKVRASLSSAAFSITPRQKKRIARAALVFLQSHPELAALSPRFDAILVAPRKLPRHIEGAWRSSE